MPSMLKAARLVMVPALLLSPLQALAQSSLDALLNQPPEKLAALKHDPHIAKAMKFLEVSDTRADILKKADGVVDIVIQSEEHEHPGQNALFWRAFRQRVQDEIQAETADFLILSAELYADRFTDAELDQLTAFYASDLGAKYFQTRRELDKEEIDLATAWSERLAPEVLEKVRAKLSQEKAKAR